MLSSGALGVSNTLSLLDRTEDKTYAVPLSTVADKCAWFAESEPLLFCGVPQQGDLEDIDAWLMGRAVSQDTAWIVEPVRGESFFVRELTDEKGSGIDVLNPATNADGTHVFFLNKTNASLWSLRVDDALAR